MPRSFRSGVLKPASSLPFHASDSESPNANAMSPRPASNMFRFSIDPFVVCTDVLTPVISLLIALPSAVPGGMLNESVTDGNCAEWLTVRGDVLLSRRVNAASGIMEPVVDFT